MYKIWGNVPPALFRKYVLFIFKVTQDINPVQIKVNKELSLVLVKVMWKMDSFYRYSIEV